MQNVVSHGQTVFLGSGLTIIVLLNMKMLIATPSPRALFPGI